MNVSIKVMHNGIGRLADTPEQLKNIAVLITGTVYDSMFADSNFTEPAQLRIRQGSFAAILKEVEGELSRQIVKAAGSYK